MHRVVLPRAGAAVVQAHGGDQFDILARGLGLVVKPVEFRGVGVDLRAPLVGGDGADDAFVGTFHVLGEIERTRAPHRLEILGILGLGHPQDHLAGVRHGHLQRIEEGTHGLLGHRVAQDRAGGPAVPEQAAEPGLGRLVVAEHGVLTNDLAHIGGTGRLAVAESAGNGPFFNRAGRVDGRIRTGKAGGRVMATGAGLRPVDGQVDVEKHFPAEFDEGRLGWVLGGDRPRAVHAGEDGKGAEDCR